MTRMFMLSLPCSILLASMSWSRFSLWAPLAALVVAIVVALRGSTPRSPEIDGEAIFRQRCAVCHATSAGAGQGPGLGGVVGRKAASGPGFGYSRALRETNLVWGEPTLDRFLSAPSALVPGTTMSFAFDDSSERAAVLAY